MGVDFDVEQFIDEVEKRPALYDTFAEDYKNRPVKFNCWSEIAAILYPHDWQTLSASFRALKREYDMCLPVKKYLC